MSVAPLSLANVQGDILFGLPKQTQSFFLFQIDQADAFRSNLANLVPLITTAEQTRSNITEIRRVKLQQNLAFDEGDGETVHPDVVTVSGVNIAFSAKGLQKMGILEELGDRLFQNGMKADARSLGDNGVLSSDGAFQPDWDAAFLDEIHGVGLITGDSHESVNEALANVKNILSDTVKEIATLSGDVRPDDQKGHEHFGYKDGISEPSVMGVDGIKPGQTPVKQGVVLLGRDGDTGNRPDWALDGSFLALRKLPQLVPEFDKFLLDTAGTQQSADLMGARFVGRWKSGAPVVNATTQDDPELGDDAERNNLFKFTPNDQSACPFAAHIRKMNPRGDLSEGAIQPHMILRRGIPFGPEVSDAERDSHTTTQERGLLFVCYQTSLSSGFSFLQQAWANQPGFPFGVSPTPGFDPIIGQQTGGGVRQMTGAFAEDTAKPLNLLAQWVNAKGGEYFFSPSIPALRDTFAKA